jgi:hypothetical protein
MEQNHSFIEIHCLFRAGFRMDHSVRARRAGRKKRIQCWSGPDGPVACVIPNGREAQNLQWSSIIERTAEFIDKRCSFIDDIEEKATYRLNGPIIEQKAMF